MNVHASLTGSKVGPAKPTATRAGIPTYRSMSAIAPAKYWQYPLRVVVAKPTSGGETTGGLFEYVKPPLDEEPALEVDCRPRTASSLRA